MKTRWADYFGGFLVVLFRGKYPERIINLALSRGIFLQDVKKGDGEISFRVRASSFKALESLAEEHNYQLEVVDKGGLPFYRQLLLRRGMLLPGALIFILALYFLSSFVWFLEVSGNRQVSTDQILKCAARHGLYEGAHKRNFSRNSVEEGIMRDMGELSYVGIEISGVKAHIEVVEKVLPGDEVTGPCHLVAVRDGIVDSLLVLEGQALVAEGATVSKGDILISGIVFPLQVEEMSGGEETVPLHPRLVRARGQIKARVWYEGYGEWPLFQDQVVLTGKEAERIVLQTPWKHFYLRGKELPRFEQAERQVRDYLWSTPWGEIGWQTQVIREKKVVKISYSEEEALEQAQSRALNSLKKKMPQAEKILDTRLELVSSPTEPMIRVKAYCETLEEIGQAQPINVDKNAG